MARTYRRDARGRFASTGSSGQSSGRGSRLRSPGSPQQRGSIVRAPRTSGTVSRKPLARKLAGNERDRAMSRFTRDAMRAKGIKPEGRWQKARRRAKQETELRAIGSKQFWGRARGGY